MIAPLLLAITLAMPAQEVPSNEAIQEAGRAFDVPGAQMKPAEVVAARVRGVLQGHEDRGAWDELAEALPELALQGGADLISTFEAANLAEGMAATTIERPASFEPAELIDWSGTSPFQMVALAALAIALMVLAFRGRGRRRLRRPTLGGRRLDKPIPVGASLGPARFTQARRLAAAGIATPEIAQRTGMAQDAVTMLVGMKRR